MGRMRTEVSTSNQYWISKHRYYELKHFCLQYPEWKELYLQARLQTLGEDKDPTGWYATIMGDCRHCMDLVESTALNTDRVLGRYIFKHVALGDSYERLLALDNMPCGRDLFYSYVRKFYWLLSNTKGV